MDEIKKYYKLRDCMIYNLTIFFLFPSHKIPQKGHFLVTPFPSLIPCGPTRHMTPQTELNSWHQKISPIPTQGKSLRQCYAPWNLLVYTTIAFHLSLFYLGFRSQPVRSLDAPFRFNRRFVGEIYARRRRQALRHWRLSRMGSVVVKLWVRNKKKKKRRS